MENLPPLEEKLEILKKIEDIGNRDFDGVDVTKLLRKYLRQSDPEIILSALQASSSYVSDENLFQEVFKMAHAYPDEEVRAMANSCLGAVIQDGLEFEEDFEIENSSGAPSVNREFYHKIKEYLLDKVDAPMESMEVRRRALEALGHIGFLPEVRKIILRFYHEAPNPYVKVSAIYAMGLVKHAVFERLILEELYSPHEPILLEAIHSAANLELQAAEERLGELSRSSSQDIRYEAIVSLGSLAPLPKLAELIHALESEEQNEEVKEALQHAKTSLKQRLMLDKGETIWDDNLILNEIQDMVDPDSGE